jgi:hypothetical protein
MKLVPIEPPGRSSRKAPRFAPEMRALRTQGYTFEAIRLALAAAGVHVSNATVQREVARAAQHTATVPAEPSARWPLDGLLTVASNPPPGTHSTAAQSNGSPDSSSEIDMRSGKEIAEAFASSRITNPLVRARVNAKERQ